MSDIPEKQSALTVSNLSFNYVDGKKLFENLSFDLKCGEILAVAGASGCGKTTLCYCLCGIVPKIYQGIMTGTVAVANCDVQELTLAGVAQNVGFVFQNPDIQLFSDFIEEDIWLGMLRDRNDCTHIYSEDMAKELVQKIILTYIPAFNRMDEALIKLYGDEFLYKQ